MIEQDILVPAKEINRGKSGIFFRMPVRPRHNKFKGIQRDGKKERKKPGFISGALSEVGNGSGVSSEAFQGPRRSSEEYPRSSGCGTKSRSRNAFRLAQPNFGSCWQACLREPQWQCPSSLRVGLSALSVFA